MRPVTGLAAPVVLAALSGNPVIAAYRYPLIVVLAVSMGIQNAAAGTPAVPDLTTTVLTMTITGIAADGAVAGGKAAKPGRRLVAVAAMFAGAVLVIHAQTYYPLLVATIITATVAAATAILGKPEPAWVYPGS
ncbi:MAG: hypothetical protein V7637_3566 [Mycobacteriales bacterium]